MRNDEFKKLQLLDFNLLKTLLVLLEEKHISKSAELLYITQPAVSKQLAKLREVFEDPLLVRVGNRQVLTPKALKIHAEVTSVCNKIRDLIASESLDLQEVSQNVSIMFSDYGSSSWVSQVVREIAKSAPNVTITCKSWSEENIQKLVRGDIHFALGMLPKHAEDHESEILGHLPNALVARKNHPIFSSVADIEQSIIKYPLIRIKGSHQYDKSYNTLVGENVILIDEASLWLALETLSSTDAILIGPSKFVADITLQSCYQSIELPMLPNIPISLSWSVGITNDLFLQWMKDKLVEIGRKIVDD
ncbi:LysR family transcriptional regulator [Photobacterium lutimaris]|uniref:HTH lysR-type domain-containing protein n=1 Tax=Photobacterium lutimaris TaxID=388278 RepID=A0A2T3IY93_9GAMM|nr:LysR family transcriptional regulator [Photobacterium lutimaris]PSU33532.1 hypothetical protein C9I99_12190 [Photobacterium lutimaris]TDR74632.1 DNA-binding transcriptional LysR family regulator [Photobacterium lutimaris]